MTGPALPALPTTSPAALSAFAASNLSMLNFALIHKSDPLLPSPPLLPAKPPSPLLRCLSSGGDMFIASCHSFNSCSLKFAYVASIQAFAGHVADFLNFQKGLVLSQAHVLHQDPVTRGDACLRCKALYVQCT